MKEREKISTYDIRKTLKFFSDYYIRNKKKYTTYSDTMGGKHDIEADILEKLGILRKTKMTMDRFKFELSQRGYQFRRSMSSFLKNSIELLSENELTYIFTKL